MTHLDSITIHNFKSFRHVNIKFSKGFNCIVGANGSGKSNICDSLLFALGESSLKRMRVPNTALLINSFAKPKNEDGVKKAYVRINFAAQNPIEISRIIKSNNKIGYRLNGKRVTRQEVTDLGYGMVSELSIAGKFKMILKGAQNLNAFSNLLYVVKKMKALNELYTRYPETTHGFPEWRKAVEEEMREGKARFQPNPI